MDSFEEQIAKATAIFNAQHAGGQQDIVSSIVDLFTAALGLWTDKNKTKYVDQLMSLHTNYLSEYNRSDRSRMALDQIRDQITILQLAFVGAVSGSAAGANTGATT